ncbi:MAG: hypothetical protein CMO29_00830 [Tistrella sp.]|uniref:NADH-ubiquinone oxidoreductase n=2 Tax=Tistrella mobilis TaxID=171437 RepID=I3TWA0_TISMK|nr:NADH-ubiquinone oxidoreductase [Tistrella mobilis KA081020-065]MAM72337.1 hypothetical protein [Tistrella sp.]
MTACCMSRASAPTVRIWRPARPVTRSAPRSRDWILEFEPESAPWIDPLTGWTGSADTRAQISLRFPNPASAVEFARRNGWNVELILDRDVAREPVDTGAAWAANIMKEERRHAA